MFCSSRQYGEQGMCRRVGSTTVVQLCVSWVFVHAVHAGFFEVVVCRTMLSSVSCVAIMKATCVGAVPCAVLALL
jgi:hypothetical protein